MGLDFQRRIIALKNEVTALKTASRSVPDGVRTTTKTLNIAAKLIVYGGYVGGYYFIKLDPKSSDEMIFSVSQKHVVVSDDVIVSSAVPRLKNGESGVRIMAMINYQRQQAYLNQYNPGDIITKNITIYITASDDFTYTIEEDN